MIAGVVVAFVIGFVLAAALAWAVWRLACEAQDCLDSLGDPQDWWI